MNRTSVPHEDSLPTRARALPPGVAAREAGLALIRRANRWLIAAAVAAVGMFSLLAAHTFHGRTVTTGGAAQSAGASGLQAPAQTPAPTQAAPAPVVSGGS